MYGADMDTRHAAQVESRYYVTGYRGAAGRPGHGARARAVASRLRV